MNRLLPLLAAAAFVVAACGSPASAAKTTPSPSGNNALRNGASGQLVQVSGQTLIITGPNGDTTVTVSDSTTYTKTSIATLADIIKGTCIVANGQIATSTSEASAIVRSTCCFAVHSSGFILRVRTGLEVETRARVRSE